MWRKSSRIVSLNRTALKSVVGHGHYGPAPNHIFRILTFGALCLLLLGRPAAPASASLGPITRPASGEPLPVLVLAGQSNMIGWVTNVNDLSLPQRATQANVLFYGPDENGSNWGWLVPPTVTHDRFGPEISLGQNLLQHGPYDLVAQVKYAASGTNLALDWNPADYGWFYAQMQLRAQAAIQKLQSAYPDRRVFVAGFFWMQGETDAQNANMAAAYAANLERLIAQVRLDFHAPALPVFIGRIRAGQYAYATAVRQAQAQVAAGVPNVRLIDTDGLPLAADHIHYTSAGNVTLGQAFAQSYLDWQNSQSYIFLPFVFYSPTFAAHQPLSGLP